MINVFTVLGDVGIGTVYIVGVYSTKKFAQEAARKEARVISRTYYGTDIEDNLDTTNSIRCMDHDNILAVFEIQELVLNDKEE